MVRVLLVFLQSHAKFRVPELESVVDFFRIVLNDTSKLILQEKYLAVIDFETVENVQKILSRSVLLKGAFEVFAEAESHDEVILQMNRKLDIFEQFNDSRFSWVLRFQSHGKKRDNNYRVELIKRYTDLIELEKSHVDLKNATNEFFIVEENDGSLIRRVYFCRFIGKGQGSLKVQYDIKKRQYIGNSTMDPELSFIQANVTQCCIGSLILDPFCGTGGLLLAASHFGAQSLGVEINYQVARAVGKSSRTGEEKLSEKQSILANFEQYNLGDKFIGVLLADSSQEKIWHLDKLTERQTGIFDAIMTDPPYGIREKGQKLGAKLSNFEKCDKSDICRLPTKTKYGITNVYLDLLNLAAKLLRYGGRVSFWFPVIRSEYSENVLPQHNSMKRLYNCEQILTKESSRRLLVYEKVSKDIKDRAFFDVNCYESESFRTKVFRESVLN